MFDPDTFLPSLTTRPGVYCMRDKQGKVLYVGKAKNLKNRLTSYFRTLLDARIQHMVSKIDKIDITVTNSEKEALLLESSLISALKPKYNVIFRDDKSYPYLFISNHLYPRLVYFRGKQKIEGNYFGPYPSSAAVRETLTVLQKLFKVRQCDDTFFNHRTRPCLQYQIQRCTAPCVGYVTPTAYAEQVKNVTLFLQGKESTIISDLVNRMEKASQAHDFELAAQLRDQIQYLRNVYDKQIVIHKTGNVDVLFVAESRGYFCIQMLTIRHGRILDSVSIFPKQVGEGESAEVLRSFITQFYLGDEPKADYPNEIVLNLPIEDQELIATTLSQLVKHQVKLTNSHRGVKAQWLDLAKENAQEALKQKVLHKGGLLQRWQDLIKVLGLKQLERVECFDISHTQGEATVASLVVFEETGALKADYRHYNIDVKPGDDYAAMEQVLMRRYSKQKEQDKPLPNLILVDGGKGQLHCAQKVIAECQMLDVCLMGIAKGQGRKPGLETLYVSLPQSQEVQTIHLPPTSAALHLLQQIRDEAHRFAITTHRQKLSKKRKTSALESIPGIGEKRRQQLLNYFGGLQALKGASEAMIAQVPGISAALASKIYAALHKAPPTC